MFGNLFAQRKVAVTATGAPVLRANAKAFDSFIDKEQAKVDAMKAKTQSFLDDITNHFAKQGLGAYLTADYNPDCKFEDLENGARRIAIKWHYHDKSGLHPQFGFSLVEQRGETRVDYMYTKGPMGSSMGHTTAPKNRKLTDDFSIQYEPTYSDHFRSTRAYDTYQDFQDDKDSWPEWFPRLIKALIPPVA